MLSWMKNIKIWLACPACPSFYAETSTISTPPRIMCVFFAVFFTRVESCFVTNDYCTHKESIKTSKEGKKNHLETSITLLSSHHISIPIPTCIQQNIIREKINQSQVHSIS